MPCGVSLQGWYWVVGPGMLVLALKEKSMNPEPRGQVTQDVRLLQTPEFLYVTRWFIQTSHNV